MIANMTDGISDDVADAVLLGRAAWRMGLVGNDH